MQPARSETPASAPTVAPGADRGFVSSRLFVYGTLRRAFRNRFARLLAAQARLVGGARVRGRLYRLDGYPGMILATGGSEWVAGELYQLRNRAATLQALDAYEGCGPEDARPHEFIRVAAPVRLSNGTCAGAWVYVYNRHVAEARRIQSGDYLRAAAGRRLMGARVIHRPEPMLQALARTTVRP